MNSNEPKIRFYSLDGNILDGLEFSYEDKLDIEKEVKTSDNFNRALKSVIEKDIVFLSNKFSNIIKDITKCLAMNGTILDVKISDEIESIESSINDIEALISNLIISKDSIKVGIFSSNKKEKKNKIKRLEDSINFLAKCQSDIITIKDEYLKLSQRNKNLGDISSEDDEEKDDVNPLERTINFYMAKEN